MNRTILFAALIGATVVLPLEAQDRAQGRSRTPSQGRGPVAVPPGHYPGPGMCRVWIDGLPPGQQAPVTDCATARRQLPANGRVLEGDRRPSDGRDLRWPDSRADRDGRDDDDDDDRIRGRAGRDDDDDDDDDAKDRTTRRFIDRNGMECEEKSVTKKGRRSYDLKCREPKRKKGQPAVSDPRTQKDDRACLDVNRDRRCDTITGRNYPRTLPEMLGAFAFSQGQRTEEVSRWLGDGRYMVRYTDQNRDRKPERVRWLDGDGSLLQEWIDDNRDGRADIVNIYSAGRILQSIGGR